jgi:TolB-like protein
MSLIAELKRRNVFKVGAAYLVVAWLVVQAASIAFPTFEAPAWALRVFIFVVMLGFPMALVIAWTLQLTPEGVTVERATAGSVGMYAVTGALAALAIAWYFLGQPSYRTDAEAPAAPVGPPSVAVLPFANLSSDPEQEFFSDGMTEELLNVLARVPSLKVAARTSVFEFKGKGGDVREIGAKLGVSHIVEGSVRREGGQVRVTAQLIRVADGFHVWSESYDRELKGVFALQDEIAGRIGAQLQTSLGVAPAPSVRAAIPPEAYDEYLKGRALYRKRQSMLQAIAHFEAAVARAPEFAAGWASLSLSYEIIHAYTTLAELASLGDIGAKLRSTAARAIALEPRAAMSLHAQANVARADFRYADAEKLYVEAIQADPTYPDVREDYAQLFNVVGRDADALAEGRKLVTIEPFVAIFWAPLLDSAMALDRRDLVEEAVVRIREIDPGFIRGRLALYRFELKSGRTDAARALLREAVARTPEDAADDVLLFAWATGEPGADAAAARELILDYRYQFDMAYVAMRGDIDLALETYVKMRGPDHTRYWYFMDVGNPGARSLLADPRIRNLLREYGFVAYWREKGWPALCRPLGDDDFECGASGATH